MRNRVRYLKSAQPCPSSRMSVNAGNKKAVDEWERQRMLHFNRRPEEQLEYYRYEEKKNTQESVYNPAKSASQTEKDACAHKGLIENAISAQNVLALEPDEPNAFRKFKQTQEELRNWRGKYVARHLIEHERGPHEDIPGFTKDMGPLNHERTYEISFHFVQKDESGDEDKNVYHRPITVYNKSTIMDFGSCHPNHIVLAIVNSHDQIPEKELSKYNTNFMTKQLLKDMLNKIFRYCNENREGNDSKVKFFTIDGNAELRNADDVGRFAYYKTNVFDEIEMNGLKINFKFNKNRVMPEKSKIYHNPKVVQQMQIDLLKYSIEIMNVDLTVTVTQVVDSKTFTYELTWTVKDIVKDHHTVYHLAYMSEENSGFLDQPKTLHDIVRKNKDLDDRNTRILRTKGFANTYNYNKQNYTGMLYLHALQVEKMLDSFYSQKDTIDWRKCVNETSQTKSYAFIYEYRSDFTIIASTIFQPLTTDKSNYTSYTIIQWNTTNPKIWLKQDVFKPIIPQTALEDKREVKMMHDEMLELRKEVAALRMQTEGTVQLNDHSLLRMNANNTDFFVAGLFMPNAMNNGVIYLNELQEYIIKKPDLKTRLILENKKRETDIEFIKNVIEPHYLKISDGKINSMVTSNNGRTHKSLKKLVMAICNKSNEDLSKTEVYPGLVGYLLDYIYKEYHNKHYKEKEGDINKTILFKISQRASEWYRYLKNELKIEFTVATPEDKIRLFTELDSNRRLREEINRFSHEHPVDLQRIQSAQHAKHFTHNHHAQSYQSQHTRNPLPNTKKEKKQVPVQPRNTWFQYRGNQSRKRDKSQDQKAPPPQAPPAMSAFTTHATPDSHTAKLQAEVDALKRTLNSLTLGETLDGPLTPLLTPLPDGRPRSG